MAQSLKLNQNHLINRCDHIMIKVLLLLITIFLSLSSYAQQKGSVLIAVGTVMTITDGNKTDTDILIEDGAITEIGKNLSAPAGVKTVDASGKYVMPGIIDAHSHIAAVDVNEWTNPLTAEVTMAESINPNDINMYWALAGGVTTINLMHGSANVIGGRNQALKLRYGSPMDGLRFKDSPQTIKFALGENPTRVHGQGAKVQPRTRMGVAQVIREHFDAALDYRRNRKQYLQEKEAYENDKQETPPIPVA